MGYDLKANNKELEGFHMGAFSWSWMLNAGVGLALWCGPALKPASFVYRADPDNPGSPHSNDGYKVTEQEAKMMAHLARAIVFVQHFISEEWEKVPEHERDGMKKPYMRGVYNTPVRDDFVALADRFADWSDKSGGFEIW